MQGETGIIKGLLNYGAYLKYNAVLKKIPNMDAQLKSIVSAIGDYYEKYGEEKISVDSLREFYFYQNPQAKDRALIEGFLQNVHDMDVSDAVLGDLLNQVVERHACTEIAVMATDVVNGSVPSNMDKIAQKVDHYYEVSGKIEDLDNDVCDLDIDELFTAENYDGLKFRGKWFQDTFGLLPMGTLGHIFGRPDSGKSSLANWQLTKMAQLIPPGRTGLYLNNEEGIGRIKRRGVCSLLDRSEQWVMDNIGKSKEMWHQSLCHDRLRYIGSVNDTFKIEKLVKKYKPALVIVDQGPKVLVPGRSEGAERLQKLYNWYRNLAIEYELALITLGQADNNAANRKFLSLNNLDNSKVGIPGELDWCVGIGMIEEAGFENVRWFNVCKNKLTGMKDNFETVFNPSTCSYKME